MVSDNSIFDIPCYLMSPYIKLSNQQIWLIQHPSLSETNTQALVIYTQELTIFTQEYLYICTVMTILINISGIQQNILLSLEGTAINKNNDHSYLWLNIRVLSAQKHSSAEFYSRFRDSFQYMNRPLLQLHCG